MKERPILFQGAMVRALLAGTKTQTRREINWRRLHKAAGMPFPTKCKLAWFNLIKGWGLDAGDGMMRAVSCPYGAVGDRLWVKETFFDVRPYRNAPLFAAVKDDSIYRADYEYREPKRRVIGCHHWRPSIFMPRTASRLLLEITAVRVERLRAITEADAKAEGVVPEPENHTAAAVAYIFGAKEFLAHTSAYATLWEQINGRGSWALNPWVWVIEFRRVTPAP